MNYGIEKRIPRDEIALSRDSAQAHRDRLHRAMCTQLAFQLIEKVKPEVRTDPHTGDLVLRIELHLNDGAAIKDEINEEASRRARSLLALYEARKPYGFDEVYE